MAAISISFLIWTITAIIVKLRQVDKPKFEIIEANNILMAIIACGTIAFCGYEIYISIEEGYFYESYTFYYRSTQIPLYYIWVLLNPIILQLVIQAFWLKKVRTNLLFSSFIAMLLNFKFFSDIRYWTDVKFENWEVVYTYSPPPIENFGNRDYLPSSWSYYPTTINFLEVIQTISIYSIIIGLIYFVINSYSKK